MGKHWRVGFAPFGSKGADHAGNRHPVPIKVVTAAAIEAMIERLIDLLDVADTPFEDCEPEPDEASDDGEPGSWPEWHARFETESRR